MLLSSLRIHQTSIDDSQHSLDPDTVLVTSYLVIIGAGGSDNGSYSCRADNGANAESAVTTTFNLAVVPGRDMCTYSSYFS